jgi:hypothetical protein
VTSPVTVRRNPGGLVVLLRYTRLAPLLLLLFAAGLVVAMAVALSNGELLPLATLLERLGAGRRLALGVATAIILVVPVALVIRGFWCARRFELVDGALTVSFSAFGLVLRPRVIEGATGVQVRRFKRSGRMVEDSMGRSYRSSQVIDALDVQGADGRWQTVFETPRNLPLDEVAKALADGGLSLSGTSRSRSSATDAMLKAIQREVEEENRRRTLEERGMAPGPPVKRDHCPRCLVEVGAPAGRYGERACPSCGGHFVAPEGAQRLLEDELRLTKDALRELGAMFAGRGCGCPGCGGGMRAIQLRGQHVDVCLSCGSAYFDAGELDAVAPS